MGPFRIVKKLPKVVYLIAGTQHDICLKRNSPCDEATSGSTAIVLQMTGKTSLSWIFLPTFAYLISFIKAQIPVLHVSLASLGKKTKHTATLSEGPLKV